MTAAFWNAWWYYGLWAVLWFWLVPEVGSIAIRRVWFGTKVMDWTLSDCIRRWSAAHHWVPAAVIGTMALLCWHWFAMSNG